MHNWMLTLYTARLSGISGYVVVMTIALLISGMRVATFTIRAMGLLITRYVSIPTITVTNPLSILHWIWKRSKVKGRQICHGKM